MFKSQSRDERAETGRARRSQPCARTRDAMAHLLLLPRLLTRQGVERAAVLQSWASLLHTSSSAQGSCTASTSESPQCESQRGAEALPAEIAPQQAESLWASRGSATWPAQQQRRRHHHDRPFALRHFATLSIQQVEQLRKELSRPPASLVYDARPPPIPADMSQSVIGKLLLNVLMYNDARNQLIVGGQVLYEAIREQVDDGALCRAFGMDPKVFYSTYTLLAIHVWLIIHRLAARNDRDARFFKQRFYNHFQADVERRIYDAGVQIGVTKWLKKLEAVFYSCGLSFDRVLRGDDVNGNGGREGEAASPSNGGGVGGPKAVPRASDAGRPDAALAAKLEMVVLREFFGGESSKALQAELITRYLLHQLYCLQLTDEEAILQGRIQFSRGPFEAFRLAVAAPAGAGVGKQQQQ